MKSPIKNLYNRPFYYGCIVCTIGIIILAITLYFYITDPYTRFENSLFQGAAVFQDVMNIFWGYVVAISITVCGLATFNLSYHAQRSDYGKVAAVINKISLVITAASVILAVWFTLQVIFAFK